MNIGNVIKKRRKELNISLNDLLKGDTKMVKQMAQDSSVRKKQSKKIQIIGSDLSSIETYYSDNKIILEEISIKK